MPSAEQFELRLHRCVGGRSLSLFIIPMWTHALACTRGRPGLQNKEQRSSHNNTHRGNVTSASVQDAITALYLYMQIVVSQSVIFYTAYP